MAIENVDCVAIVQMSLFALGNGVIRIDQALVMIHIYCLDKKTKVAFMIQTALLESFVCFCFNCKLSTVGIHRTLDRTTQSNCMQHQILFHSTFKAHTATN